MLLRNINQQGVFHYELILSEITLIYTYFIYVCILYMYMYIF